MWPHLSQRWWEVSHRMVAPQLSHGGRPPFGGTAQAWSAVGPLAGPMAGLVAAVVTPPTVRSGTDAVAEHAAQVGQSPQARSPGPNSRRFTQLRRYPP
jgi:hypothetical protein